MRTLTFNPEDQVPPFVPDRGPQHAKLAIVGEAPGTQESIFRKPFIGPAGSELDRMLKDAGLDPKEIYFTNVFPYQPPENQIKSFFCSKASKLYDPEFPPMGAGQYILNGFGDHVRNLRQRLALLPNLQLICPVGNTALWAITGKTGIGALRGTISPSLGNLHPNLPTYHPSAVLRTWAYRSVVVSDFQKAKDYISGGINLPSKSEFTLHLDQSLDQLNKLVQIALGSPRMAIDVETEASQIRTVGIAYSPTEAFVIPFFCSKSGVSNYWQNPLDEIEAWKLVKILCESDVPKVLQNGLYDIQRLLDPYGIIVKNVKDDTMLLHHALQPEMPKSLDFLASTYLNTEAWKAEYRRSGSEQHKRDE